jgi:microcystin-dependent protein
MANPFLGQIEIFGFSFPPKNWVQCNGQILPINQNQALFALLGTTYGGNGTTTFALPDLRGRVPVGVGKDLIGNQWTVGQVGGQERVKLTSFQIPAHTHTLMASSAAPDTTNTAAPSSTVGLGQTKGDNKGTAITVPAYVAATAAPAATLHASAVSSQAAGQPHENRMPLLALNICICLAGIFPSRN